MADHDGQGSAKRRKIEPFSPSNGAIVANEQRGPIANQTTPSPLIQDTSISTQDENDKMLEVEALTPSQQAAQGTLKRGAGTEESEIWPAAQMEDRTPKTDGAIYEEHQPIGSKRKLQDEDTTVLQTMQDPGTRPVPVVKSAGYVSSLPGAVNTASGMGHGGTEVDPGSPKLRQSIGHPGPESRAIEANGLENTPKVPIELMHGEECRQQKPLPGLGLARPSVNDEGQPSPQTQLSNGHANGVSLPPTSENLSSVRATNEKLDPEFVRAGEVNEGNENAEWQLDSSDAGSSSSSDETSSDSDSSSDSEDVDDYKLLNPEEQARILMEGEGGSDDEGAGKGGKAGGGQLRTKNEKPDEKVQKPKVNVTAEMKVEELGAVESLVENLVVIGAKTSGEYKVLETGSVLCLEDRTVIGVVAETLGRVHQPLYSVRFSNAAEIAEAGIGKGTRIYYIEEHSTFVFTEPLKAIKGSDASNLHDEEVAEDEMEFSDDEAEAEYKKRVKQERQAKRDSRMGLTTSPSQARNKPGSRQERPNYNPNPEISYDDVDDGLYTPLIRPSNFHEIRGPAEKPHNTRAMRGNYSRGDIFGVGRGHSRGDYRGQLRGGLVNRGDRRGGVRGHHSDRRGSSSEDNPHRKDQGTDIWGQRRDGSHESSSGGFPASGPFVYNYEQQQRAEGHVRPRSAQNQDYDQSMMPPPSSNPPPSYASQASQPAQQMRSFHLPPNYPQMQQYPPPSSPTTYHEEPFSLPAHFNPAEPYSHFYAPQQQQPDFRATPMPPPEPFYNQGPPSAGGNFPAGAYVNPAFFPTQQQRAPMHPQWTQAPPHPSQYSDRYQSSREPPPANWGPGPPFQQPPPDTPWSSQQQSPTIPAQQARPIYRGTSWSPTADEAVFTHGQWSPPDQQTPNKQASQSLHGVGSPVGDAAFDDVQKQLNILRSLNGGAQPFEPRQQR
ncbi:MAG: hypothetical protein M1812_007308 [Candelaria pacifica]|nr:MAG: hypothetical protein M1812_007308 [Candelaria pacifica]